MTDLTATIPTTEQQTSGETIPWALDVTPLLSDGETPSAPVVTLIDLATNTTYTSGLSGSPSFAGNVVTATVTGLVAGHTYELRFKFQAAAGKIFQPAVRLECPR